MVVAEARGAALEDDWGVRLRGKEQDRPGDAGDDEREPVNPAPAEGGGDVAGEDWADEGAPGGGGHEDGHGATPGDGVVVDVGIDAAYHGDGRAGTNAYQKPEPNVCCEVGC